MIAVNRQRGYVALYQLALNFQIFILTGGKFESWIIYAAVALCLWTIFDIKYLYPSEQSTNYENHPLKEKIEQLEAKIDELKVLLANRIA